jgi:hypothetical protein
MPPTHEQVLAAIDKAREDDDIEFCGNARNAHCDDLRATAERHQPIYGLCRHCYTENKTALWPCPDAQQVIDRLTAWGVL